MGSLNFFQFSVENPGNPYGVRFSGFFLFWRENPPHPVSDGGEGEFPNLTQEKLDDTYDCEVKGVVDVEKPFHASIDGRVFAALTVIKAEKRDGEDGGVLHQSVGDIQCQAVNEHVQGDEEKAPDDLFFRLSAVGTDNKNAHGGDAAPIGGEGNKAHCYDGEKLLGCGKVRSGIDAQKDESAEK